VLTPAITAASFRLNPFTPWRSMSSSAAAISAARKSPWWYAGFVSLDRFAFAFNTHLGGQFFATC
jgi:hypothetical protein